MLLCCGNVSGVHQVNDMLVVKEAAPEAQWHTVVSGDNLSKIAKHFYGKPDWKPIFDANRDQLDNPDRIFPGQVLKIPAHD